MAAFTALGWWIGGLGLASVFFVVCLLMAATVFWYGPRIVLASLGARELTLAEATLLHTTVERLAARAGVGRPRLYLLPSGHPHAISVGRGVSSSAVGLSKGLTAALPPAELEGVIAHELAKIRQRDVVVQTPVVVLAGWLVEASRIGGWLSARAPLRPRADRGEPRPDPALAEARVRRRPARRGHLRLAARPRRRARSGSSR